MRGLLGNFGAIGSAMASSVCCWLPWLIGAGAAASLGISSIIAYGPALLGLTAILLSINLVLAYRTPGEDSCGGRVGRRRIRIGAAWAAAAAATGFASVPYLTGMSPVAAARAPKPAARQVVLAVPSLDCPTCVPSARSSLAAVPGVTGVSVDLATRRATVSVRDGGPSASSLIGALKEVGYEAKLATNRP